MDDYHIIFDNDASQSQSINPRAQGCRFRPLLCWSKPSVNSQQS